MTEAIIVNEQTHGSIAVLNRSGDSKLIWDRTNEDEVAAAAALFDSLKAKSFLAYRAKGKKGTRDEQITKFDATAERIIMVPPMQGG